MLVLYRKDESNFDTLGYGVLRDLVDDPLITEVLNGTYTLEFNYLKEGWLSEYIIEGNIIKANGQLFRIRTIKKSIKNTSITVFAKHIWFDNELNNWLEDVSPTNKLGHVALEWILDHANESNRFTVNGDCTVVASARYVRMNPIEAVYKADNCLLDRFKCEIEMDNFNIFLHNHRGSNTGLQIRQEKNLSGADYNVDLSTLVTRIMPIGKEGILLPEKYVDSPLMDNYHAPFYYKLEVDIGVDEENGITLNDCYIKMREEANNLFLNGIDKPKVTISIDFVELSKTKEYSIYSNLETAHLGDSCNVYIPGLNLNVTTRIVKVVWNCNKERIVKVELGTPKVDYVTSDNNIQKNIQSVIDKLPESLLSSAQKNASNMINHPFGGYIYISENTGELYIMDTNDISTAVNIWKFGLGGIGFSSTGINGTFNTAITQDGKIVADFITTGVLNTSVINGYGSLVSQVQQNTDMIGDRTSKTSTITQDIESLSSSFITSGGDNIFRNTGLWYRTDNIIQDATIGDYNELEYWIGNAEYISEDNATNGRGMSLLNNSFEQSQSVKNGKYCVTFYYKKTNPLANIKVIINNVEYELSEEVYTKFTTKIEVSDALIDLIFVSDTNNACIVYDLMVNVGEAEIPYNQNQNEVTTDTVKISKGITISSSNKNTIFKADADGIRVKNDNNANVTYFTDVGMETKQAVIQNQASITGLLFQRVNGQTWISWLGDE